MSDPVAQGLGGLLLLGGFGLLQRRPPEAMIALYRTQAIALAAASLWQGHVQGAAGLYLVAAITLGGKAMLLPVLLRQAAGCDPDRVTDWALPTGLSLLSGIGLLGLALLVLPPSGRQELFVPLAAVLLGLASMAVRRDRLGQVIGFLAAENGLVLAAVTLPGLPLVVVLAAASLAFAAALLAALRLGAPDCQPGSTAPIVGPGR